MEYKIKKPSCIKKKKILGRGPSSGLGKTSGRGHKGQGARSGGSVKAGFEGGQMPLQRRLPKRGFNNIRFRKEYQIVNLSQLVKITESEITADVLKKYNLISDTTVLVKILGKGDFTKSVKIVVDAISESAKNKIINAGGTVVLR